MKKIVCYLLFFPLCLLAELNSRGDFQIWLEAEGKCEFADDWFFILTLESYFGDDARTYYSQNAQFTCKYVMRQYLELGIGDSQAFDKSPSGVWTCSSRPFVEMIFKAAPCNWKMHCGNRFSRIFRQGRSPLWGYRNDLCLAGPWRWTALELYPYIRNKLYVRQNAGFNQDIVYVGIKGSLLPKVSTDISWIRQFFKTPDDSWTFINALGISLSFCF